MKWSRKLAVAAALLLVATAITVPVLRAVASNEAQSAELRSQEAERKIVSEAFATRSEEQQEAEQMLIKLKTIRHSLNLVIEDTKAEHLVQEENFLAGRDAVADAIAADEKRMEEVEAVLSGYVDRIVVLVERVRVAKDDSEEQEAAIEELVKANAVIEANTKAAAEQLDALITRQNALRETAVALKAELDDAESKSSAREAEAASLLSAVKSMRRRVAELNRNIAFYEGRKQELIRIIAMRSKARKSMKLIRAKIGGTTIEIGPGDLILGGLTGLPAGSVSSGGGTTSLGTDGFKVGGKRIW